MTDLTPTHPTDRPTPELAAAIRRAEAEKERARQLAAEPGLPEASWPLGIEATIVRWPAWGDSPAIKGRESFHLVTSGYSVNDVRDDLDPSMFRSLHFNDVGPSEPGWFSGLLELRDPRGYVLGDRRPFRLFGRAYSEPTWTHFGSVTFYPGAPESWAVGLRVVWGGYP